MSRNAVGCVIFLPVSVLQGPTSTVPLNIHDHQVTSVEAASPAPSLTGLTLHKMAAHDNSQTFLEMFEATATACGWLGVEWAARLLPLLSGDAQTAALGLPAPSRGQYGEIKRAVLDGLGFSAEDHRRRFRGTKLGPAYRPFVFTQQHKDAVTRWLQPGDSASEGRLLEKIILEQFVEGLPAATLDWMHCHRPADLAVAVTRTTWPSSPGPGTWWAASLSHAGTPQKTRAGFPTPHTRSTLPSSPHYLL